MVISGSFTEDAIFLAGGGPGLRETCLLPPGEARPQEVLHPVDLEMLTSLGGDSFRRLILESRPLGISPDGAWQSARWRIVRPGWADQPSDVVISLNPEIERFPARNKSVKFPQG